MRLLHTSDWHIGRSLHGADLLAEQEAVLGGLADVVAAESVDEAGVATANAGDASLSGLLAWTAWFAVHALGVAG